VIRAFLFLWLLAGSNYAQNYLVSGTITDNTGEAVPFANVYLKGTTRGTTSNEQGNYTLKLASGNYTLVFQHVGYAKWEQHIDVKENKQINIVLKDEGISLKEVVVKAGENPADIIMRKAIKKRSFYLNQVSDYSCNVYIKGLQRLNHISKNMMKLIKMATKEIKDSTDILGVLYLSESQSDFYYQHPNRIKEVMKSSKVSGSSQNFSFNQYRYLKYNFYENLVSMSDVSNRPFVSPLNDNAFLFYRFKLLGSYFEDGKEINKIEVIPKRETDPVFSGIVYIQENTWRITGLHLYLTKKNKINFVDTIHVKQLYSPVSGDSIWLPQSSNMEFSFTVFGFSGNGYFNTVLSDYNLQPIYEGDFFKDEIVVIEKGANEKDSAWWAQNRPIPLTNEEQKDYRKKDSIATIVENPAYIDSVDRKNNRFKAANLINGYTYSKRNKKLFISMPGIADAGIQYNTVEGVNISYDFNLSKYYDDGRLHQIHGRARYGFSNNLPGGEISWRYLFNHNKFRSFGVNAKSIVEQYNNRNPISQLVNSLYTLLLNDNYMKLYRESGAGVYLRSELAKGINGRIDLNYSERQPLFNTTDLLMRDDPEKLFTSNDPLHPDREDLLFKRNDALLMDLTFSFRFKQRYYNIAGIRYYAENNYPRVSLTYRKAVPINVRSADFDILGLTVYDNIRMGLFGVFMYNVKGGYFARVNRIYYMDYRHFSGNQTIIANTDYLNSFRLLPYYSLSTRQWYAEGHAEQHFNGFILNKIPFVKNLFIQEVAGFHVLVNDRTSRYIECNVGLKNILKVIRVDYVMSFQENKRLGSGFMLGFSNNF